uniref:Berberine/berberine-like domain-containing protein n=1 Tax=Nelumbo nucifera TaxID=4432 RepID=A0A822YZ50_NELNU|nr:TPA_asm: hypothetical protein HUJ06_007170 [Nelumbo nucifera]
MGEDLFWAIRGGGGASFGLILSWKIRLVPVPATVTVFRIAKTLEEGATKLVHRWQYVAPKLHEYLFIRVFVVVTNSTRTGERTVNASFLSLFLGGVNELLPLMNEKFPELGLKRNDCTEMSWIESVLYTAASAGLSNRTLDALLDRNPSRIKVNFKGKSVYVKQPIPRSGLEGLWARLLQVEQPVLSISPFGGRMSEIPESATPFPHREGNLYKILYLVNWQEEGYKASEKHISWMRSLYSYMAPYVSKFPREAYLNYRDLDLGTNNIIGNTSYEQASVWGRKYFKNNFERLVEVKRKVDPSNFFRNEQSIPVATL